MTVKNREIEIRTVNVTRYIMPLREGGSLPALAEADDGFKYVVKFRGAGHGTKALIAELIGGEVARALKLRLPEIVFLIWMKLSAVRKGMRRYKTSCREAVDELRIAFSFGSITFRSCSDQSGC